MKILGNAPSCLDCGEKMDLHDVGLSAVYGNVRVLYRCRPCRQRVSIAADIVFNHIAVRTPPYKGERNSRRDKR